MDLKAATDSAYRSRNEAPPESSLKAVDSGINKLLDIKDAAFVYNKNPTPQKQKRKEADLKFIDEQDDFDDEPEAQYLNKKWQALFDEIQEKGYKFRYNVLTQVLEYKENLEWEQNIDLLLSDLIFELENNRGIKTISKSKVHEMIMTRKIVKAFNPIDEFIKTIPEWDGNDHIKEICDCIGLPDDEDRTYFNTMMKKHLIRTLRCATDKNNINRIVTTFYGGQKIGKSLFWKWLTPSDLYYDEPINLNDKDSFIALSRYLIINIEELDQLTTKETGKLKAYVSKGDMNKRLPYGRRS
jgi:predicted P-loop ATPase